MKIIIHWGKYGGPQFLETPILEGSTCGVAGSACGKEKGLSMLPKGCSYLNSGFWVLYTLWLPPEPKTLNPGMKIDRDRLDLRVVARKLVQGAGFIVFRV